MFSEIINYTQSRVNAIQDLEKTLFNINLRLNELGQRVGLQALELLMFRDKNTTGKREAVSGIIKVLSWTSTVLWKWMVNKEAEAIQKSTENEDECRSN